MDPQEHARFAESVEGTDYGVVKPGWGGRWNWPLSVMEVGDYFHVAHEDKAPGNLRHLVSVRAAQLGKSFSVRKDSPMMAGYTLVMCAPPREEREASSRSNAILNYELGQTRIHEHYARIEVEKLNMRALYEWEHVFAPARQVKAPAFERIVFTFANITLGAIFKPDGVLFMQLPKGATPAQWEMMEAEWDAQREEWKREEHERSTVRGRQPDVLAALTTQAQLRNELREALS